MRLCSSMLRGLGLLSNRCLQVVHSCAALDLFRKTKLFVSVHGGALTNMVFMPGGASVFEFRLKDYNVRLYEDMAHAIRLRYYSTMAEGGKGTVARPNITEVGLQLRLIRRDVMKRRRDS